ncbi:hypothetical protein BJV82DRAFT_626900 [Fennellomyces sp. T-0311]|nr:hypothetical protein BJV82DRAFT_626900 [Fennellomyces sp. T-0311]
MSKSTNVISPSSSTARYSTHTIIGGMHRSGSNRSIFLRETSTSMKLTHSSSRNNIDQETARNLSVDYQEIQKRTLTKWVNAQLTDDHIENMESDLRDGKRLLKLLSVVSKKEPAPKPERGNMRIHQLSNVAQALKFLEKQLGEVPDIGNEAIVNGDLKMTLALISFIMLKYHLQLVLDDKSIVDSIQHDNELIVSPSISAPSTPLPSATKSSLLSSAAHRALRMAATEKTSSATEAKVALLRWVRIQLHDYVQANIIPSIQDFSRSWRNGVAFCLLLHRHDPNLVPELFDPHLRNASTWTKQTWTELLKMAFDVGEHQLHIPRYLEPEDLTDVDYPHEPSVMMYVTEFYKVMKSHPIESHANLRQACIADLLKFLGHAGPLIEEQNEDVPIAWTAQKEEDDDEESTPITPNDPVLDELISDRDTLATFISSFAPAIEAMTKDEISSAEAVTQRMFAFDAIREQANGQQILLDAVNAKQQKLQDQQEAASIYHDLERRWHDFVGLMDSTATKLQTMQSDWQEGEQDVKRFQQSAATIEKQIQTLRESLDDAYPTIIKKAADQSDVAYPLQPLEEDASADAYEASVATVAASADAFRQTWHAFQELHKELSMPATRIVNPQFTRLQQKYESLMAATTRSKEDCGRYKRGVSFADITRAVNDELEIVKKTLNDTKKVVTDDAIQDLEKRVQVAQSTLDAVREEYVDLIPDDAYYAGHLQKIQTKSEIVSDWVHQVRVWFIEAERIRKWIGERIDLIEQRDLLTQDIDPLAMQLSMTDDHLKQLYDEHQALVKEINQFDATDMTRLRTHVRTLTGVEREKELSPADTSTIEITFTTLNMLNKLKELMNDRSYWLDMLMSRSHWQNLFSDAVKWIATTDEEMNMFLRKHARYSDSGNMEEVIETLMYLEKKIPVFDKADYTHVLEAYEEMEAQNYKASDIALPNHLEKRQQGFEEAFEDLMNRCQFCRKVVEQYLKVVDVVRMFHELKEQGEALRQAMLENNHNTAEEEELYTASVQKFKEQSAYLITHYAAQVPYPVVPETKTAIGTGDEQDNELANEQIRSTIGAYGTSLALLAEGLDQLLANRQYVLSLHERAKSAYDKMTRLTAWMDERIRTLNKTKIDIKNQTALDEMEEEEVTRLEKERDGIHTRLHQIEQEDLTNILQEVRQLEDDVDASNAVSIDRHSLVSGIEGLEMAHQQLESLLTQRAFDLDVTKRYMAWQTMYNKSNHLILTVGRKIWDLCIKKARFDPSREDIDRPSYAHDNENAQALQLLQDRVTEIGDRHMTVLGDMHQQWVDTELDTTMVNEKQSQVEQKYADLQHLLTYTTELMTQRSIITEFLLRVQDAQRDGEKIRDAIAKMTRRIMETQQADLSRADQFGQTIDAIWQECGQSMPYPTYNGSGLLRSLQPTETANYNAQIKAQIKALIDRKMDELQALKEAIDQLLETYRQANHTKTLTGQYDDEAAELQAWIDEQAAQLKQQHIDITADNATFATMTDEIMQDLETKHGVLVDTLQEFETIRLKQLHDKVAQLMENSIKSVDITQPVRRLGQVMSNLEQLKDSLADHRVTMEAANKRIIWQKKLQAGREQLEAMSERLRTFNANKSKYVAQESFNHQHVEQLEHEWDDLIQQKNVFSTETLPAIEQSYDTFVAYFAKLARPVATPDHIEAWMESLNRATNRFEENLGARSKELDLVRQRLSFDDQLHGVLQWLQEHQQHINAFIEDRERWNENEKLRDAWIQLNQEYQNHCDNVIRGLLNDLNELREASYGANMILVSDPLTTKITQLDHMQKRIQLDLAFAEGIVTQRCLMREFLDRMAALEQSAEQIREAIASSSPHENMFERVQALRSESQRVDRDMTTHMLYPTRDGVSTQQQLKDDAMNSLVRDTIETKSNRLATLLDGLEELLESKENVSRRKMAMEAYRKEFQACMDWIDARKSMLERARTHIPSNIPGLRDGISLTDNIQSTSQASENAMTTLKAACRRLEEWPQEQSVAERAWADLLGDAAHTKQQLLAALVPAEIQERAQRLLQSLQQLYDEISQAETATVTDDQISQWQKQVDEYESRDYQQLQADASNQTDNDVKEQLDRVAESAMQVRRAITTLYDAVNKSRLQKTHGDNADVVQARLKEVCAFIHAAQQPIEAHDVEQVKQQYQQLVSTHKETLAQMDDCKEAYNDLVSYFNFIRSQIDVDEATEQRQADIDAQWSELEMASDHLQQLVSDMAKSVECHETLARLTKDLVSIKKDVDAFDIDKGESVLDAATRRLQTIVHVLGELANSIDDQYFLEHHASLMQEVRGIEKEIEEHRKWCAQQSALDAFKQQAKEIKHGCLEQLAKIRAGEPQDTETYGKLLSAAKNEMDQYDVNGSFALQCERLVDELQVDEKAIQNVRQPVIATFEALNGTIKDEEAYLEFMKQYAKHEKSSTSLRGSLDALKSTITGANSDATETPMLISDMEKSIEESLQALEDQGGVIVSLVKKGDKRYGNAQKKADDRYASLKNEYHQLKHVIGETLARMEKQKKHRDVSAKLTETMRYVDKLKDRANALQMSSEDKSIITVEQEELQELEQEVAKISLDAFEVPDNDKTLKSQRASLEQSISTLQDLLAVRRSETQGNIGEFIQIVDRLEKQAGLLQTAIDDAAPHHAAVVNNKFSKTDLQSLLRNLVASYKTCEPKMTQLVKKAKAEAGRHSDDPRVSERLTKALARCNKIKAGAAARERELQTCISQLDHEFFTKLAMVKSTPRKTVKKTGLPPLPSVSMTRRSSSQSSSASTTRKSRVPYQRPSKTPIPSRSVSRTRYVADPKNELDMELGRIVNENAYRVKVKMVPGEVGKYWFGEVNPRLVYCRILPSKLVMVRVGGGWVELSKFLHDHKLNEGSIRTPAADDTISSTSSSGSSGGSSSTSTPFQSSLAPTTRCRSPSGRITVRGGGGVSATSSSDMLSTTWSSSSRRSSKTPRGGYVEGDKYIRVDEAGNQLMVKMTKAEDGAKMPIVTRRRT